MKVTSPTHPSDYTEDPMIEILTKVFSDTYEVKVIVDDKELVFKCRYISNEQYQIVEQSKRSDSEKKLLIIEMALDSPPLKAEHINKLPPGLVSKLYNEIMNRNFLSFHPEILKTS